MMCFYVLKPTSPQRQQQTIALTSAADLSTYDSNRGSRGQVALILPNFAHAQSQGLEFALFQA
jgi:hypothetical protein